MNVLRTPGWSQDGKRIGYYIGAVPGELGVEYPRGPYFVDVGCMKTPESCESKTKKLGQFSMLDNYENIFYSSDYKYQMCEPFNSTRTLALVEYESRNLVGLIDDWLMRLNMSGFGVGFVEGGTKIVYLDVDNDNNLAVYSVLDGKKKTIPIVPFLDIDFILTTIKIK